MTDKAPYKARMGSDIGAHKSYNAYCMLCRQDNVLSRRDEKLSDENWYIVIECRTCGTISKRPRKFNPHQQGRIKEELAIRDTDTNIGENK